MKVDSTKWESTGGQHDWVPRSLPPQAQPRPQRGAWREQPTLRLRFKALYRDIRYSMRGVRNRDSWVLMAEGSAHQLSWVPHPKTVEASRRRRLLRFLRGQMCESLALYRHDKATYLEAHGENQ